jgi:hypothetical protein
VLRERADDAAHSQLHAAPHVSGDNVALRDDVSYREPSGPQHAQGLRDHAILVTGQVIFGLIGPICARLRLTGHLSYVYI